jgi:outer membrane protein TolC
MRARSSAFRPCARRAPALLSALAAFLWISEASAAEGSGELSLSAFVAEVEDTSPDLEARRLRTRAARSRVEPARALPDPFVAVGVDELALGLRREGGTSSWPRPVLRYQVNQTFPLPAERRARRDEAATVVEVGDADVAGTARSLRVAAVQLFLQARYVEAALRTNAQLVEAIDDAIASAEARYMTGGSTHHEVLLGKAERAVLRRDALLLERELDVLFAQMNELRGLPPDTEIGRLVDDAEGRPHRPISFGAALAQQPELQQADATVALADARVRVAKTAGHPDLSVQLMAMQSLTPSMPSSLGAMVGITIPLYWGRKQGPTIKAAKADRRAAQLDRDALHRRLAAEWVAAERAYDTSVDTVRLYEKEVLPATRAAVESAKIAYVAGNVSFSELVSVVRATLKVELEHVASQTDVRLARLRLEELVAAPTVVRIAPAMPTLFGSSMGAGMGEPPMAPVRPISIGSGMQPPSSLDVGSEGGGGSMRGMR